MAWADAGYVRALNALNPRTKSLHSRVMRDFMMFGAAHAVTDMTGPGPILAYMEFLWTKGLNFRTIMNYVSALKQNHNRCGLSTQMFDNPIIKQYFKAIAKSKPTHS